MARRPIRLRGAASAIASAGRRVLVATDSSADQRKTLAAVRSLGRHGCDVVVGCDPGICPPAWSRHCRERITYPSPFGAPDEFVDALSRVVRTEKFDALLPLSDHTTIPIAMRMDALSPHVGLCVPRPEAIARAHDKLGILSVAHRLGIAVPETHCIETAAHLDRIGRQMEYPCVFKLRKGAGGVGLRFPSSAQELFDCYHALRPFSDVVYDTRQPLVQERISGDVHDACLLFDRGRVRAAMTQKRLVMYPRHGGVGILNMTTDEPELRDQAIALLEALDWHGPAMVEFRKDDRDGRFKLMEINGRFWGTLGLAIEAGIEFPWLAYRLATEGTVPTQLEYEKRIVHRWMIPFAFLHAKEHRSLRALWEFVRPRPATSSDLRAGDPLPHLAEALLAWRVPASPGDNI